MILIAGYGFLGSEIARQAKEQNLPVTALSRSADGIALACDITDRTQLAALDISPTHIIHCASSGKGGGPERYRNVYVDGLQALIDTFPKAHITFTSSTSVYSQTDGSIVTEESATEPIRKTGHILLEAEQLALTHHGTVCRLAGLYGKNRSFLFKRYLAGEATIEGDGTRHINQIHNHDAASAILHLLSQNQTGLFNVADSTPLTQQSCYEILSALTGHPIPPSGPLKLDSKRGWSDKQVSNAKLLATGWKPKYPTFIDAVPEMQSA